MDTENNGIEIHINGKVQGVGFRPYVWLLAKSLNLKGDVSNDGTGVIVHLWQEATVLNFLKQLPQNCPPLASIKTIKTSPYAWHTKPEEFTIIHSGKSKMDTHIVPDAATCNACLDEMNTPSNKRYAYPFINCTHCGPRFTIIEKIPYDRANTSMKKFLLCPQCLAEYEDPANRRFHAQPNACPQCGPHVFLCAHDGSAHSWQHEAIQNAVYALEQGQIVAIKGIGGFHLACDALNPNAVQKLRQRKNRPSKPFAVMLPNEAWLHRCVHTASHNDIKTLLRLLRSPAAPIVLVQKNSSSPLCQAIAPNLNEIGVMFAANPIQHLLLQKSKRPLVMTSGNARGKPPALSNEEALHTLKGIADLWLMHDRDIVQRADDSVVRFSTTKTEFFRRARGYVPDALETPAGFENCPPILAMGADLKNTFCLLREQNAIVSQHFGDLLDIDIQQQVQHSITLFQNIYQFSPQAIAIDAHPHYVSHKAGKELAQTLQIPAVEIIHHHAHIVACMAEHGHAKTNGTVVGLALDGLGYGSDGHLWGGECLLVDYTQCKRVGGLPAVALIGGDLASTQPWRNLLAHLITFVPNWQNYPQATYIPQEQIPLLERAMAQGLNTPKASSTGRLFDAVAAALGIAPHTLSWEAQAASTLQALASSCKPFASPITIPIHQNTLDLTSFWSQWLSYQAPPEQRAYAFHDALAKGFAQLARQTAMQHGLHTIVLSGGVIHNTLLRQLLEKYLAEFEVLSPIRLPAGDGGISYGQALIAAAQNM